jgi:hypothetical protein
LSQHLFVEVIDHDSGLESDRVIVTLNVAPFADLSNEELLAEVSRLAIRERQATAALIRCLMEVDSRRLYLSEGYSSLSGTSCSGSARRIRRRRLWRWRYCQASRRPPG